MFDIVTSNNYSFFTGLEPCLIKLVFFQAIFCLFSTSLWWRFFLYPCVIPSLYACGSSNLKLCHRPIFNFAFVCLEPHGAK